MVVSLAITAVPFLLVLREPDLGTSLVFPALWLGLVFWFGISGVFLLGAGSAAASELDDVGLAVDRLEVSAARLRFHEAGDVLVGDLLALRHRDGVDELAAAEQTGDLVVAEHPVAAGKAEARSGDHHRPVADDGAIEELCEETAELGVHVSASLERGGRGRRRRRSHRCGLDGLRRSRWWGRSGGAFGLPAHPEPGGVEAAQGVVERDGVA